MNRGDEVSILLAHNIIELADAISLSGGSPHRVFDCDSVHEFILNLSKNGIKLTASVTKETQK